MACYLATARLFIVAAALCADGPSFQVGQIGETHERVAFADGHARASAALARPARSLGHLRQALIFLSGGAFHAGYLLRIGCVQTIKRLVSDPTGGSPHRPTSLPALGHFLISLT